MAPPLFKDVQIIFSLAGLLFDKLSSTKLWPPPHFEAPSHAYDVYTLLAAYIGTAVRLCNINGKWETPVVTNCSSYEYRTLMVLMAQVCYIYMSVYKFLLYCVHAQSSHACML